MSDAKTPPDLSMDEILATIRRIIAEDEQSGGAGEAASVGAAAKQGAAEDDVLELTEAVNEDGTTRHLAPIGLSSRAAPPPAVPPKEEPPKEEPPAVAEAGAAAERLVSEPSATAAAAAFARIAEAPRERPAAALVGDRPVEDVAAELLRPMLKAWLDENLPALVERLVAAEISRISGGPRSD